MNNSQVRPPRWVPNIFQVHSMRAQNQENLMLPGLWRKFCWRRDGWAEIWRMGWVHSGGCGAFEIEWRKHLNCWHQGTAGNQFGWNKRVKREWCGVASERIYIAKQNLKTSWQIFFCQKVLYIIFQLAFPFKFHLKCSVVLALYEFSSSTKVKGVRLVRDGG